MAYDSRQPGYLLQGTLAPEDLSGTGLFGYTKVLAEDATLTRLQLKVTTLVSSSAPAVVTFYKRPVYGTNTNQVTLGTVSLPGTAAKDKVYYKDIDPVNVNAGDQIVADVTTAATSAGGALFDVLMDYTANVPNDMTNFIASA